MEDLLLRIPHIPEQIFGYLDSKSLTNCREVSRSWKEFIDNKQIIWTRILDKYCGTEQSNFLLIAAKTGQTEIFEKLFYGSEDQNPKDSSGLTPFLLAAKYGHFGVGQIIMENEQESKIDFLSARDKNGLTGFHWACQEGHFTFVKLMLENSIKYPIILPKWAEKMPQKIVNNQDSNGWTGLHWACKKGQFEVVELLMKKSKVFQINLNAVDKKGMTSFHWLCLEGFSKIAKLFLDNTVDMDIDLNLKDNTFLWTGFHFACYYGKTSIVDMILTNSKSLNIDLTASDELGRTGFQLAQEEELIVITSLIQRKMPSIVVKDNRKKSASEICQINQRVACEMSMYYPNVRKLTNF